MSARAPVALMLLACLSACGGEDGCAPAATALVTAPSITGPAPRIWG